MPMARRLNLAGLIFRLSVFFSGIRIFAGERSAALVSRQKVIDDDFLQFVNYFEVGVALSV